jgi:hypothetical protein
MSFFRSWLRASIYWGNLLIVAGVPVGCSMNPVPDSPDAVVRKMFHANASRDLKTIETLVSQDVEMVGYTIGGRKYVGWKELARDMQLEFESVNRLEIPVKELRVWQHGDVAWYTMEIDYIRYEGGGAEPRKTSLPLRESGVLQRRQGRWLLVQWHESLDKAPDTGPMEAQSHTRHADAAHPRESVDLSGQWEIREEDKAYQAVLDSSGNGSYNWQQGTFVTTGVADGHWQGTWHQAGNDREGAFEVRLSEDRTTARGRWWYTRVGNRGNIPPRQWGGEYRLIRVPSVSVHSSQP